MTGGEVGTAKPLGFQGLLYAVAGGSNGAEGRFLIVSRGTQNGQGQVDGVPAQFHGCAHEAVENTGDLVFPADQQNLTGKFFVF